MKTHVQMKSEQALLKKVGYTGNLVRKRKPAVAKTMIVESKLSNQIPVGVAPKREPQQYSGKRTLLGIATMHKSNMVPVFSQEDAESISKMRR